MAAAARAVTRSAASTVAPGGLRRMYSIFADLDLKRGPELPPRPEPSTKLFVAGLNKQTVTSERLRDAFSKFGQVVEAHVVTDRATGQSRGFGFVRYGTLEEAEAGKKGMDNKFLDGWVILADFAKPRPPATAAPENLQFSPSFQGVGRINTAGGNPHASTPYQSPPSNEHIPVNPQTSPSLQDINLNDTTAGNLQSSTPYHSPPSNEPNGYSNAVPVNPQTSPSFQDINVNKAMAGNPQSHFYQSQPSHQSSSSYQSQPPYQSQLSYQSLHPNEHSNYNNVASGGLQSPNSYQHNYNPYPASSYQHNSHSNQVPVNPSQSPYQHNSYNGWDSNQVAVSPSQSPYQRNSYNNWNNVGPVNPQSPPIYQHNAYNSVVPENPHSLPSYESGNYDNQVSENQDDVPSCQYGN